MNALRILISALSIVSLVLCSSPSSASKFNQSFSKFLLTRDGSALIGQTPGKNTLEMVDTKSGAQIRSFKFAPDEGYSLDSIAVSPDGKYLAAGGTSYMKIWNPDSGDIVKE